MRGTRGKWKCGCGLTYRQYNRCCPRETRHTTDEYFTTLIDSPFHRPLFPPPRFVSPQTRSFNPNVQEYAADACIVIGTIQIDIFSTEETSQPLYVLSLCNVNVNTSS